MRTLNRKERLRMVKDLVFPECDLYDLEGLQELVNEEIGRRKDPHAALVADITRKLERARS